MFDRGLTASPMPLSDGGEDEVYAYRYRYRYRPGRELGVYEYAIVDRFGEDGAGEDGAEVGGEAGGERGGFDADGEFIGEPGSPDKTGEVMLFPER
jgi:hypothetical protein